MSDDYAWWRAALAGQNPPTHEGEPQCGYFKVRDWRGVNSNLAPIKRPWVAGAIWRDGDRLVADFAGSPADAEAMWLSFAKHPIAYEDYAYWHRTERWPEQEGSQ